MKFKTNPWLYVITIHNKRAYNIRSNRIKENIDQKFSRPINKQYRSSPRSRRPVDHDSKPRIKLHAHTQYIGTQAHTAVRLGKPSAIMKDKRLYSSLRTPTSAGFPKSHYIYRVLCLLRVERSSLNTWVSLPLRASNAYIYIAIIDLYTAWMSFEAQDR